MDSGFETIQTVLMGEGTPASSRVVSMALASLAFLLPSLCLAENCYIIFLKLVTKVYLLIWPVLHPEADYQGPLIKVQKSRNQKPPLPHLTNTPN